MVLPLSKSSISILKKTLGIDWYFSFCSQIELGPKNRLSQSIPAYGYWNVQFYQMEAAYVHFDLWLPRGASLGFYARRNALPTHTNYDLMEVIKGTSNNERNARSIQVWKMFALLVSQQVPKLSFSL